MELAVVAAAANSPGSGKGLGIGNCERRLDKPRVWHLGVWVEAGVTSFCWFKATDYLQLNFGTDRVYIAGEKF